MSSKLEISKVCLCCGDVFIARTLYTRYCSHACNQKHYKQVKRAEKLAKHQTVNKAQQQSAPTLPSIEQKAFLSIKEAATLLGASERTIQRLIAKNVIRVAKLGRRCIIQRLEIDKLFK